ncbi:Multidrug resistance-associated protein 1 [Coemansia sp. RSA 552]|nr:Multidrug resistance-associated protein 1 [Coemansia sp. RSA 552]
MGSGRDWAAYLKAVPLWIRAAQVVGHVVLMLTMLEDESIDSLKSLWGSLLFTQEKKLMSTKNAKDIQLDDLPPMPARFLPRNCQKQFKYNPNEKLFVVKAIIRMIWRPILPLYIVDVIFSTLKTAEIVVAGYLMRTFDMPLATSWKSKFGAILLLFLLEMLRSIFRQVTVHISHEWDRVKTAIDMELRDISARGVGLSDATAYRKAKWDAERLVEKIESLQRVVTNLVSMAVSIWPLYSQVGRLVFVPFCVNAVLKIIKYVFEVTGGEDYARTNIVRDDDTYQYGTMEDVYSNIRAIKLFGWENMYLDPKQKRDKELRKNPVAIVICKVLDKALSTLEYMTDKISSCTVMYMYIGSVANGSVATTAADLFQLTSLINTTHGTGRSIFNSLRQMGQIVEMNTNTEAGFKGVFIRALLQEPKIQVDQQAGVCMEECSFTRNVQSDVPFLKDITFSASKSEVVAVTGSTGSGKSMFLLSVCGQTKMLGGTGGVAGRIGYLEQSPWIMNDTIRANILLGRPFDRKFYEKVLFACAFIEDLAQWKDGDLTVIGDRGIKISGGQRARLSLARALYTRADIYVLDDPLSAVDAHTKRHILEHAILDTGLLAGKLRIIGANTEHMLPFADQIVAIDKGNVTVTKQVARVYKPLNPAKTLSDANVQIIDEKVSKVDGLPVGGIVIADGGVMSLSKVSTTDVKEHPLWENITYVLQICGRFSVVGIMMLGLVNPILSFILDGYVLDSLKMEGGSSIFNLDALLKHFCVSIASTLISDTVRDMTRYIERKTVKKMLEDKIKREFLESIIHAPLSYFDGTTEQELRSAYNKGTEELSSKVVSMLKNRPAAVVGVLLSLYRALTSTPYVLLLAIPNILVINKLSNLNTALFDHLGNLRSSAMRKKSNVSNATRCGQKVIRIFGVGDYFNELQIQSEHNFDLTKNVERRIHNYESRLDSFVNSVYSALFASAVHLQHIVTGAITVSAEYNHLEKLKYRLEMYTNTLIRLPKSLKEISRNIDILRQYCKVEPEAPYVIEDSRPAPEWPQQGGIKLEEFSLKYRPDLEDSLKSMNLEIKPGEKIGIVGRSGAGKSTLAKALFRLVPSGVKGALVIDGQEIAEIGVGDLRPRLGIIPQEHTMLAGTVRENLDPLEEFTIEEMWSVLIKCGAAEFVSPKLRAKDKEMYVSLREKRWMAASIWKKLYLAFIFERPWKSNKDWETVSTPLDKTAEGTRDQLSSGQQQLFSLCRLLIRKPQVLILDEATAEVDLDTDRMIQEVIRREFGSCTILTIAHRLETVMNSDRIIVMDHGRVAEIGPPQELLDKGGYFAGLVKTNDFGQDE